MRHHDHNVLPLAHCSIPTEQIEQKQTTEQNHRFDLGTNNPRYTFTILEQY